MSTRIKPLNSKSSNKLSKKSETNSTPKTPKNFVSLISDEFLITQ
jgi:hypothetical protein